MSRIFVYDNREFDDPDPAMDIEEVRKSLSEFFGELSNATHSETKRGEDTIIEFTKRVGTKGSSNGSLIESLGAVPEVKLRLITLANQNSGANGKLTIVADADEDWQDAVTEAQQYASRVDSLRNKLEKLCWNR